MPTAKRSRQLDQAVIGLDLGGTKLASALFDAAGKPLIKRSLPLNRRKGHAVGETHRQPGPPAVAIGGAAQPCGLRRGRVRSRHRAATKRTACGRRISRVGTTIPLKAEIKAAVSNQAVKIAIESDRTASILGEAWQGAARDCRNAIFLAVGTGIGAGILVDGRVLRGAHGIAGAIGWLALERPFRPEYVSCGCFESHASGHGIANMAQEAVEHHQHFDGRLQNTDSLTAQEVFSAYEAGDETAKQVLLDAIGLWGMASANLISLFNPEKLIFGGGVFGPATQFLDAIAAEARRWAQPIAFEQVTFASSQLGEEAALYGAAHLALRAAGHKK